MFLSDWNVSSAEVLQCSSAICRVDDVSGSPQVRRKFHLIMKRIKEVKNLYWSLSNTMELIQGEKCKIHNAVQMLVSYAHYLRKVQHCDTKNAFAEITLQSSQNFYPYRSRKAYSASEITWSSTFCSDHYELTSTDVEFIAEELFR